MTPEIISNPTCPKCSKEITEPSSYFVSIGQGVRPVHPKCHPRYQPLTKASKGEVSLNALDEEEYSIATNIIIWDSCDQKKEEELSSTPAPPKQKEAAENHQLATSKYRFTKTEVLNYSKKELASITEDPDE